MTSIGECLGYCGQSNVKLYDDIKIPPMDTDKCLCKDCAIAHAEEAIEEFEIEIQEIQDFIKEELK